MTNKFLLLLGITALVLCGCQRKAIPEKTRQENVPQVVVPPEAVTPDTVTVETTPPAALPAAMIIIDGYGNVLTPKDKLPADAGLTPNYSAIARSFTPKEIANLKTRYKTVPPKVIYVPDVYTKTTSRGTYAIYKKKFWYWKKADGLFYLDKTYYD